MITVRRITEQTDLLLADLCDLLIDAVHSGASVGFLAPLAQSTAEVYWQQVFASLSGDHILWVAESEGKVIGTVQLAASPKENGRHRAEIQKLFVHTARRGRGIASKLMQTAEDFAHANDRLLLVLDTQTGSDAEAVYQHLGWQKAGEIPLYAASPDGRLHATSYFYKILRQYLQSPPTT